MLIQYSKEQVRRAAVQGVILVHENVGPYSAADTVEVIRLLKFELLPHPSINLLNLLTYLLTSLLTNSKEHSPSRKANYFSASQETPHILWNPKVHYHTHTSARQLFLSWASSIQSILPYPTSWRFILILSSHFRLGLPSGLFPSGFSTKTLYTPLTHSRYMLRPSHSSRFYHPKNTGWRVQTIKLLNMYVSPLPCYLFPLRPKYSPQQPQPTFLPQCDRPSFITIQDNRENYSSVYLNFYIFG